MPKLAKPKFRPHAIVLTETPSPIFAAAIVGTKSLRIDLTGNSFTFVRQAIDKLKQVHPLFKVTGLVVNFKPDFAVEVDLQGNVIAVHDHAWGLPLAYVALDHAASKPERLAFCRLVGGKQGTSPTLH